MNHDEADAVAAAFALGAVRSPPLLAARGANGFIWKLETERGAYAVKRLQPWIEDERRPFDIDVQLAAADAGIPLPRPVLTPDGAAIVERTRVYDWVDVGEQLTEPVTVDVAREAGGLLGRLHVLDLPVSDAYDPWYDTPPARPLWDDVVHRARAAGMSWADDLADEVDFLI